MGARKVVAVQTAVAKLERWTSSQYLTNLNKAVQIVRGVVKSITIIAPIMEANRYLVLSIPSKMIQQLMKYVYTLPQAKKKPFILGWVSKNQIALITKYFNMKTPRPNRFKFDILPVPKTAQKPLPRKVTPRRVTPTPRKVTPRPAPRRAPARKPARKPAPLATMPSALRPKFDKRKRIITIPVPSSSAEGSQILWKLMKLNISFGSRSVSFIFGMNFVASKQAGRVSAITLSTAIAKLIQPYMRQQSRKIIQNQQMTVTEAYLSAAIRKFLKLRKHSDIKAYLVWPKPVKKP